MRQHKVNFITEVDEQRRQVKCCAVLLTIVRYLRADQAKRPRSFYIGVTTVAILVMLMIFFSSVMDTSLLLFMKMAQEEEGAIDFVIKPKLNAEMYPGDANIYALYPPESILTPKSQILHLNQSSELLNQTDSEEFVLPENSFVTVFDDHLNIRNELPILRVPYFMDRLKDLPSFEGFAPRWYMPAEELYFSKSNTTAVITVLILNTEQEARVSIGFDQKPVVLGPNEMQLQAEIAKLIGVEIGDQITMPLDFSSYVGDMAVMKVFALMLAQIDDSYLDFSDMMIHYIDMDLPLTMFGVSPETLSVSINFTLSSIYDRPNGKFHQAFTNSALIDCHYIFPAFIKSLKQNLDRDKKESFFEAQYEEGKKLLDQLQAYLDAEEITFCDFAIDISGVLKDQPAYYMDTFTEIKQALNWKGEEIADALTLHANFTISQPLAWKFYETAQVVDFLSATLISIIIFLALLSSVLVYSLMLSDVDAKTYEYGMLRALGFKKTYLVTMISFSSFSFSIPGMLAGLAVAFVLNVALREAIFLESRNALSYDLAISAAVAGLLFGTLMPFLSNLFPIKATLGQNLRYSLDVNKRVEDKFTVKMERLENLGLSMNQMIVAVSLCVIGVTTLYFIPQAFQNQKYELLFILLNMILLMIVAGLTFLSTLIFSTVEAILVWLTLNTICCRDKSIHQVISKNMQAHQKRNVKTSVMFTMAVSFMIYSANSFQLLGQVVIKTTEQIAGADIYADAGSDFLNEIPITEFMEQQRAKESQPIIDYSFVTVNIDKVWSKSSTAGGNVAVKGILDQTFVGSHEHVLGVPRNFLNVTDLQFYVIDELLPHSDASRTPDGRIDAISLLYSDDEIEEYPSYPFANTNGYNVMSHEGVREHLNGPTWTLKMLVSTEYRDKYSVRPGDHLITDIWFNRKPADTRLRMRTLIKGTLSGISHFHFSKSNMVAFPSSKFISVDQFKQLVDQVWVKFPEFKQKFNSLYNETYQWVDDIPKQTLFVKLNPNISDEDREIIANGIRHFFLAHGHLEMLITKHQIEDTAESVTLSIKTFTAVVTIVALLIAFFLLSISMTQNINEAIWEYGVLRSMGVSQAQGQRIYMYEAFAVVASASILGTATGYLVVHLVANQLSSFVNLPLQKEMPWYLLAIMLMTASVTTFVSVYFPIKKVNESAVAQVIKAESV